MDLITIITKNNQSLRGLIILINFSYLLLLCLTQKLYADSFLKLLKKDQIHAVNAKEWTVEPDDLLTPQQIQVIGSGFEAFFTVQWIVSPDNLNQEIGLKNWTPSKQAKLTYQHSCKIKYDTWNERYNYTHSLKNNQSFEAKSLQKIEKACIKHNLLISDIESWNKSFELNSNYFVLALSVEQLDSEKSSQLKNWFIKQQNSMFQGIFAHMIGEIKTAEFGFYAVPQGYFRKTD